MGHQLRAITLAALVLAACIGCKGEEAPTGTGDATPKEAAAKGGAGKMQGMGADQVTLSEAGKNADATSGSKLRGK